MGKLEGHLGIFTKVVINLSVKISEYQSTSQQMQ